MSARTCGTCSAPGRSRSPVSLSGWPRSTRPRTAPRRAGARCGCCTSRPGRTPAAARKKPAVPSQAAPAARNPPKASGSPRGKHRPRGRKPRRYRRYTARSRYAAGHASRGHAALGDEAKRRAARIAVAEVQRHHAIWSMAQLAFEVHRALPVLPAGTDAAALITEVAELAVSGRAGASSGYSSSRMIAVRWNRFMAGKGWQATSGYPRPTIAPNVKRQVAMLNLPHKFDWVRLLTREATAKIAELRGELEASQLRLPTSTPDLAVVALPERCRDDDKWLTDIPNLSKPNQAMVQQAYRDLENQIEPGEILLAVALKRSLRSNRLYQSLYEANIIQLLLEGHLRAPQVEFEVHTLDHFGTDALHTYDAASLYSVLVPEHTKHKAVRELYVPANSQELARRLLTFLTKRTAIIS